MSLNLEDDEAQQQDANTLEDMLKYLKVIALALCEQQELDLEELIDDLEED